MNADRHKREWANAHRLVRVADAHLIHHGSDVIGRINRTIAIAVTTAVGSMWAAYLFCALALISLPAALHSGNTIIIVGWAAQTFLQLVLLPIIIVGQNVQAIHADERAQVDHETLELLHQLNVTQLEILTALRAASDHSTANS